jgi:hypothetical protein
VFWGEGACARVWLWWLFWFSGESVEGVRDNVMHTSGGCRKHNFWTINWLKVGQIG